MDMSCEQSFLTHNSGQNFHLYATRSVSYWQAYFDLALYNMP